MSNWIQIFWWKLHKHYFYLILSQKWQAFHLTPAVVVRSKNCWLNSCISVIIFFILSKHQFIKFLLAAWLFQVHSFMSERNPEIAKFCWYQKWVFLYGPNCFATGHKLTSFGLIFITLPQLFLVDQTNIYPCRKIIYFLTASQRLQCHVPVLYKDVAGIHVLWRI